MKNFYKLLLLIFVIFLTGCAGSSYQEISAKDAYSMMVTEDVFVVDVRTLEEFNTGHLDGAINVPVDSVKSDFSDKVTDNKDSKIIIYCQSGRRAIDALNMLSGMGYTNLYTFGGINDWSYELE